jgi:hypothetical protein
MGIYTNRSFGSYVSDYRDVEPFVGEHFNYHELGIIAASESAANNNAFMKAIALGELASVEQCGSDRMFYEAVDFGGIVNSIKKFFQKIIEKIHKIFHTFIAKMASWFGSSEAFAKKYEKEIIDNWNKVSNDWEFKGYKFINTITGKGSGIKGDAKNAIESSDNDVKSFLNAKDESSFTAAMDKLVKKKNGDAEENTTHSGQMEKGGDMLKKVDAARDKFDNLKNNIREKIITAMKSNGIRGALQTSFNIDNINDGGFDAKEYTQELFKVFRNDKDSAEELKLSDLGSTAHETVAFLKDFPKIKTEIEEAEKAMTKSIQDLINAIDKVGDAKSKGSDADNVKEPFVRLCNFYKDVWGFIKEAETEAFGALLEATKNQCTQAKEICVKVIGLSKKMTKNESYNYSNGSNNFGSFIENVKLV